MLAVERRSKIMSLINERKSVLVQELSDMFGISEETVRRDLAKLEKQGMLVRTYGGAVLPDDSKMEMPVEVREVINPAGKNAIGKRAAEMVNDGDIIVLDASTSALFVAKNIKNKKALTVITNAEKVVLELAGCDDITVISTGGTLRHKSLSYVGRAAENSLRNYCANKVFFSCRGLNINRGLTDSNEQEVDIKKAMINCAEKAILLCDHTKFGKVGFVSTACFEDIDCLITDAPLPEDWQKKIEEAGVEVEVVSRE